MKNPSKTKPYAKPKRTTRAKPTSLSCVDYAEYDKRMMVAELEWKEQRAATTRLKRETLEGELIKKGAAADIAAGVIEEIRREVLGLLAKNPKLSDSVSAIFKRYL